jgi:hypothetical protein
MGMPETRYARSGDVMIAYQVVGEGPFDVVVTPAPSPTWGCTGTSPGWLLCCAALPSMRV